MLYFAKIRGRSLWLLTLSPLPVRRSESRKGEAHDSIADSSSSEDRDLCES